MPDSSFLPSLGLEVRQAAFSPQGAPDSGVIGEFNNNRPKVFPLAKEFSQIVARQDAMQSHATALEIINRAQIAANQIATNFNAMKNGDAKDAYQQALEQARQLNDKITNSVDNGGNSLVQRLVHNEMGQIMVGLNAQAYSHLLNETRNYDIQQMQGNAALKRDNYQKAMGTPLEKAAAEEFDKANDQLLVFNGIDPSSDAGKAEKLKARSGALLEYGQWLIRTDKMQQAQGFIGVNKDSGEMTRSDWFKLNADFQSAAKANALVAANKPKDFFALYKQNLADADKNAPEYIEVPDVQGAGGVSPQADISFMANINGGKGGMPVKMKKVKLEGELREEYVRRAAMDQTKRDIIYWDDRSNGHKAGLDIVQMQLNDLVGKYNGDLDQARSDPAYQRIFDDLTTLSGWDAKRASDMIDAQFSGEKNSSFANWWNMVKQDPELMMKKIPNESVLRGYLMNNRVAINGQQGRQVLQEYSWLQDENNFNAMKQNKDMLEATLLANSNLGYDKKDFTDPSSSNYIQAQLDRQALGEQMTFLGVNWSDSNDVLSKSMVAQTLPAFQFQCEQHRLSVEQAKEQLDETNLSPVEREAGILMLQQGMDPAVVNDCLHNQKNSLLYQSYVNPLIDRANLQAEQGGVQNMPFYY